MEDDFTDVYLLPDYEVEGDLLALYISVRSLAPDRTQYKPYSPFYFLNGVLVKVTVTLTEVIKFGEGDQKFVILTPKGLAMIADQLSTAFDRMHDNFRGRSRNFMED